VAYRFRCKESVQSGYRRIVRQQIDKAVKYLAPASEGESPPDADPHEPPDHHEAVHEARKCFKKIRAALRIVRPSLGDVYAEENAWFRDVARSLSRVRDAEALIETLDALRKAFDGEVDGDVFDPVREALVARRQRIADEEVDLEARLAEVVGQLGEARQRVGSWSLSDKGFDALAGGVRKTYGRGRDAMADAAAAPKPEHFHEWRKRVKYHRYHMDMLRSLWPKVLDAWRDSLHDLTDHLGDNHDLDVLRDTLLVEPELARGERRRQTLLGLAGRRQKQLQRDAHALGRRVYAEKPKRFTDRLAAYWDAWKADGA
jgi:CHAD domain-containing protein